MGSFGLIADTPQDVAEDLRSRRVGIRIAHALPSHVDYGGLLDRIPDQGTTSSCVGWAFSTAIYLRARIAGLSIARPSAKAIYDVARLVEARSLIDRGARPRAALIGMRRCGLVDEARWPLTSSNVDEAPTPEIFRTPLGATLGAYYRISGDIVGLVRSALAAGFIPFFGMPVDEAFVRFADETPYAGLLGAQRAHHAMAIVGYGPGYVRVANSWGARWGNGGFGRISESALAALAFDTLVPSVLPSRTDGGP